tara:strand:- start:125 stop:856 length:732 start_codon:yes stop_codon:yes gene_type:complete
MFYLKLWASNILHWLNTLNSHEKPVGLTFDGIMKIDSVPIDLISRLNNSISNLDSSSIKLWESEDKSDARIFGVEKLVPEVYEVASFLKMEQLGKEFYGTSELAWFCMFGKIQAAEASQGSGGGWHRDSIFRHQVKIIVYLTDADRTNGCFQYIQQSHRSKNVLNVRKFLGHGSHRYLPSEIEETCDVQKLKIIDCIGAKGHSILVDTRGIHRGMPLEHGERKAITFYMYPKTIPSHMASELQ